MPLATRRDIGQFLIGGMPGTTIPVELRSLAKEFDLGGVILFTRNFKSVEQLTSLVAEIHTARQPPLLVTVDQEGGRVQRFRGPFVRLPPLRAIGRLYDEERELALGVAGALGWLMAAELRAVGVDLSFAPCVDLDRGLARVIGDRAWHPDANVVAKLFIHGARDDPHHLAHVALLAVVAVRHADDAYATMLESAHLHLAVDGVARQARERFDDEHVEAVGHQGSAAAARPQRYSARDGGIRMNRVDRQS